MIEYFLSLHVFCGKESPLLSLFMEKQCTLKNRVSVKGAGLHTRQCGTLTFNPAPVNSGIRFRRIDLENQPIIEADVDNVIDTARGTTLGKGGVKIYTVEHVLASLRGMGYVVHDSVDALVLGFLAVSDCIKLVDSDNKSIDG